MAVDAFLYLEDDQSKQVEGESTDQIFAGYIEIFKFSFDAVSDVQTSDLYDEAMQSYRRDMFSASGSDGETGADFGALCNLFDEVTADQTAKDSYTFSVEKQMDCSSPLLFKNFCMATARDKDAPAFNKAIVYLLIGGMERDPDKQPEDHAYIMFEFENLYVTKYELKHDSDLNIPDEKISFYFDSYVMTYRQQKSGGEMSPSPVAKGFDFKAIKPLP